MDKDFLQDGFDFREYLNTRFLEIENLDLRRDAKELMNRVMLPLYEYVEGAYHKVEERVMEAGRQETFHIVMGVEERDRVDLTDEDMQPIDPLDMEDTVVDEKALREALDRKEPYYVYTVFVRTEYRKLCQMTDSDRVFKGSMVTPSGTYPASFRARPCRRYADAVSRLYPVFVRNMAPWKTVNMSYLWKMADVCVLDSEVPKDEEILEARVDFEEFEPCIRYHMVPLWNVTTLVAAESGYPELCLDRINYKHIIFKHKLNESSSYLVDNPGITLWSVKKESGDIAIVCDEGDTVRWKLIEFHRVGDRRGAKWPYLTNEDRNTGSGVIRTRAQVGHYLKNLGYEGILRFAGVRVTEGKEDNVASYDMNESLSDEIRQEKQDSTLLVSFVAVDEDSYLNEDILSYLVSRLQWELPEYHCCGQIVKDSREGSGWQA